MKLRFGAYRITLVVCPMDMRCGFKRLDSICGQLLGIDLTQSQDLVVFVSKTRAIAMIVFCDSKGSNLLTRRLHSGHYQRLLMSADSKAVKPLSVSELERYLDGLPVEVMRNSVLKN